MKNTSYPAGIIAVLFVALTSTFAITAIIALTT